MRGWLIGLYVVLGLAGLFFLLLVWLKLTEPEPDVGLVDGRLRPCPNRPKCVSSQSDDPMHAMAPIPYEGSREMAMARLLQVVEGMQGAVVLERTDEYVRAEYKVPSLLRWVDDVEFCLPANESVIHFRSATRVNGYYDQGANRKRMEAVRRRFEALE